MPERWKVGRMRSLAGISLILLSGFYFLHGTVPPGWDFRNNLWGPAHLLLQGSSPYRVDMLFESGRAVWMPMAVGLFLPLGFFPLQQASNLWLTLNTASVVFTCWLVIRLHQKSFILQAVGTAAAVILPISISHFLLGQISFLISALVIVVVYWRSRLPDWVSAFLLAVALTKPQLGLLIVPGWIYYRFTQQGGKRTITYLLLVLGSILLLSVPLFYGSMTWIADLFTQLGRNPSWSHPSSLTVLQSLLPVEGIYLWLILAAVIFGINLLLWRRLAPEQAVLWSLALTTVVSPYLWSWDFVLVLPLFLSHLSRFRSRNAVLCLSCAYLVSWALQAWFRISGSSDFMMWWVPWMFLAAALTAGFLHRRAMQAGPV